MTGVRPGRRQREIDPYIARRSTNEERASGRLIGADNEDYKTREIYLVQKVVEL